MTEADLFPHTDCRFSMRLDRGAPQGFFAPTGDNTGLLAERRRWLDGAPQHYAGLLPEGVPILEETIQLMQSWGAVPITGFSAEPNSSWKNCLSLGKLAESDFVLLKPDPHESPHLVGGVVCFPSHWSLPEKLGQPMTAIHAVVPGLNAALGKQIAAFLNKLRPGTAWFRSNWGLARTPELNDHPSRALPRLGPEVTLRDVWLRLEHQALVALPRSNGILFGIRVKVTSLEEFKKIPAQARGLVQALETMPEEMARYKGLATAHPTLLDLLRC